MDKILLKNLKIYGYHGVLEEEKKLGQNFYIDLELFLDLQGAGKTDDLKETINYADIYNKVEHITKTNKYDLIETLAENIANSLLSEFTKIKNIRVNIKKPQAPIDGNFDHVGVEIYR
ncbi:MAG: dihydroneopterin aldolase [Fusobacteriota bacterium]